MGAIHGSGCFESPQEATVLPTSHKEHPGTEEPPLQDPCNPRAAQLLSPSGRPCSAPSAVLTHRWWSLVPRGVWKASIDSFRGTCCHPSPAPSSTQGALGALGSLTPPRSPHLAHLLQQSQSSSYRERIFGRKQLRRVTARGPFGLPGEPLQPLAEPGAAATSLAASDRV